MTMRRRGNGTSKKGPGLVYGANYARVMVGTWWREYVSGRRAGEHEPVEQQNFRTNMTP